MRAEVCRAFFKRGARVVALSNDHDAGLDWAVGLFLKVFEQNKLTLISIAAQLSAVFPSSTTRRS